MPTVPGNIASLAREYSEQAIRKLARLANHAESESVQLGACVVLLDRGWGKAPQAVTTENSQNISIIIRHIIDERKASSDTVLQLEHGDDNA